MNLSPDVKAFLDPTPRRFAEVFMNADPNQCSPVEITDLMPGLQRRRAQFEAAGIGALRLIDGTDQSLDDQYVLATTVWRGEAAHGEDLDLRSTYILRRVDDSFE